MELFFASSNAHKIEELRQILPAGFSLKGLKDLEIDREIPETGTTITENALLKARFLSEFYKNRKDVAFISDDSGLEVNALNGEPGVYSGRYAGQPRSDEKNNTKLLAKLNGITDRRARFITVVALILNGETRTFEGTVKGTIGHEPRGMAGFGYDPLFIPQGYRSTFAELGPGIKNTISHRAEAVKKLVEYLSAVA